MLGIIVWTRHVVCSLRCKSGGMPLVRKEVKKFRFIAFIFFLVFLYDLFFLLDASQMLNLIMLSLMPMVELVNGAGQWISWKTCFEQLYISIFFFPYQFFAVWCELLSYYFFCAISIYLLNFLTAFAYSHVPEYHNTCMQTPLLTRTQFNPFWNIEGEFLSKGWIEEFYVAVLKVAHFLYHS
jgi:hypothetical protein